MGTTAPLSLSSPIPMTVAPSCFQKFKSNLASKAITMKRCMKECCSADGKTYALIVLGRFFQAASMAGGLASLTTSFFFGPVTLLGTLPSAGLFALGYFLLKKNIPRSDSILFSLPALNWLIPKTFVPGQPVGLVNSSANCWINACLQCILNNPTLCERACKIPELAQFIQQYQQTQNTARSESEPLNGANLNAFLIAAMRLQETGQISPENRHADVAAFFEWLFHQYPLHQLMNVVTRPNQDVSFPPAGEELIRLQITPNTTVNVQERLNHFFDYTVEGFRQQLKFVTVPDTIGVNLVRNYAAATNPANPTTFQRVLVEDPVEGIHTLTLPQGSCFSNTPVRYLCSAFIVHLGSLHYTGHYVAYVKKHGKWWYCDDHKITEVSETVAMEQMKKSYLVFLNRG